MKLKSLFGFWSPVIITIILLFSQTESFSQQWIRLKNGLRFKAIIVSRSNDTLFYKLTSEPFVQYYLLMEKVDTILSSKPKPGVSFPGPKSVHRVVLDTIQEAKKEEIYLHYKRIRNIGAGFVIGGAIVTGVGLGLLIPALQNFHILSYTPDWVDEQLVKGIIVTAVGGAGLLTGIIMSIKGSTEMKKYAVRKSAVSLDFKYTPGQTGISLIYRF